MRGGRASDCGHRARATTLPARPSESASIRESHSEPDVTLKFLLIKKQSSQQPSALHPFSPHVRRTMYPARGKCSLIPFSNPMIVSSRVSPASVPNCG